MKKAFLVFSLLFFVNVISFAQESGNRIYGNTQTKRTPTLGDGVLMSSGNGNFQIDASVLLNLKPDSFVAVFGVAEEAKDADESNGCMQVVPLSHRQDLYHHCPGDPQMKIPEKLLSLDGATPLPMCNASRKWQGFGLG